MLATRAERENIQLPNERLHELTFFFSSYPLCMQLHFHIISHSGGFYMMLFLKRSYIKDVQMSSICAFVAVEGVCSPTQKARRGIRVGPRFVHINHKCAGRRRFLGAVSGQTQKPRSRRVRLLPGWNQRRRRLRMFTFVCSKMQQIQYQNLQKG